MTNDVIIRDINADFAGGIAEVSVHFPEGLNNEELRFLERLVKEANERHRDDGWDVEDVTNEALFEFCNITGKRQEEGNVAVIEYD